MKDKSGLWAGATTLIFALAALGALLGLGLGWKRAGRILQGAETLWRAFPLPEGARATRFVKSTGPALFAESSDGRLFAVAAPGFSRWYPATSVEEFSKRSDSITGSCTNKNQNPGMRIPAPPGAVKEQIDCEYRIPPEAGGFVRFVQLEDGTLWRWSNVSSTHAFVLVPATYLQFTCLYGLGYGLGGAALGLALALGLAWRARRA